MSKYEDDDDRWDPDDHLDDEECGLDTDDEHDHLGDWHDSKEDGAS